MRQLDTSMPRQSAERYIAEAGLASRAEAQAMTLDQLAEFASMIPPLDDDPLSVRDVNVRPIVHSRVYFRGKRTDTKPYLATV